MECADAESSPETVSARLSHSLYGSCEMGTTASMRTIPGGVVNDGSRSVNRVINCRLYVLDRYGQLDACGGERVRSGPAVRSSPPTTMAGVVSGGSRCLRRP